MEELSLTIHYKDEEMELPLNAYPYGYTYRVEVKVGEEATVFEPDEEGSYRAFAPAYTDKALVAMIAQELQKLK